MFGKKKNIQKAMAMDNDFDFDFDFDDEMDDASFFGDGESMDFEKNKSNRSPALNATADVAKGISDAVISKQGMKTILTKVLPKSYGEVFEEVSNAKDNLGYTIGESLESLNSVKKQTQNLLRKAIPAADRNGLTKLSGLLNKVAGEAEDSYDNQQESIESKRDDSINKTLGELFSLQTKVQQKQKAIDEKKELAKDAIETTRFEGQYRVLASVDASLRQSVLFSNTNTFNYYRKSIELGIRQLHVLSDIYHNQSTSNITLLKTLNDIKLNTGLPDYVKMKNTEALKQQAKQKFFGGISSSFLDRFTKNIGENIAQHVGTLNELTEALFPFLEDGMDSLAEEDDGFGESKARRASSLASGSLLALAGDRIGKSLRKRMRGNKYGDKILEGGVKLNRFKNNMGPELSKMLGNKAIEEKLIKLFGSRTENFDGTRGEKESNGFVEFLLNGVDWLKMHVDEASDKAKAITVDNLNGYKDFNTPEGQQRLTNKSVNVIIPGYLSRILREITMLRTGAPAELLDYNHATGSFQKSSVIQKDLSLRAIGESAANTFKNTGNDILTKLELHGRNKIGKLEYRNGFTKADADLVGQILISYSKSGNPLTPELLSNPDTFSTLLGEEKAKIIANKFKELDKKDLDTSSDEISNINSTINNASKSLEPNIKLINNLAATGQLDYLRRNGLVSLNGKIGYEKFMSGLSELSNDDFKSIKRNYYSDDDDNQFLFRNTKLDSNAALANTTQRRAGAFGKSMFGQRILNRYADGSYDPNRKLLPSPHGKNLPMSISDLEEMGSFATGGYTGKSTSGNSEDELAGVVHKDEYVINQEDVKNMGGPSAIQRFINMFRRTAEKSSNAFDSIKNTLNSQIGGNKEGKSNLEIIADNTTLTNLYLKVVVQKLDTLSSLAISDKVENSDPTTQTGKRWWQFANNIFRRKRQVMGPPRPNETIEEQKKSLLRQNAEFLWGIGTWPFRTGMPAALGLGSSFVGGAIDLFRDNKDKYMKNVQDFYNDKSNKLKDKFMDVYKQGTPEPILKAKDFMMGKYRTAEGKVIKKWEDIQGSIYDEEGNLLLTYDEFKDSIVMFKNKPTVVKAMNWFKEKKVLRKLGGLAVGAALLGPAGVILAAGHMLAKKHNLYGRVKEGYANALQVDVYLPSDLKNPVMLARDIKDRMYYDEGANDYVTDARKMIGPIYDVRQMQESGTPTIIVTQEEIEKGLVDKNGNKIGTMGKLVAKKLSNMSGNLVSKTVNLGVKTAVGAFKLARFGFNLAVGAAKIGWAVLSGAASGFKSGFDKGIGKVKSAMDGMFLNLALVNDTNRYLYAIYNLLDKRIPLPAGTLGDVDGDGLRENGMADNRKKRAEEKKEKAEDEKQAKRDFRLASMIASLLPFGFGKGKKKGDKEGEEEESGGLLSTLWDGAKTVGAGVLGLMGLKGGSKAASAGGKMAGGVLGKAAKFLPGKLGTAAKIGGALVGGGKAVGTGAKAAGGFLAKGGLAGKLMGGATKLGGKFLGGLGMVTSGVSMASNLAQGNFGDAAWDAGGLALSAAMTPGIGLGGLASGLGTAATFLATNPIGWAILGTAAVGAVGYGLYKLLKNDTKINDKVKARLLMYGFNPDEDEKKAKIILKFENMLDEAVRYVNGQISIDESKLDIEDVMELFDVDKEDKEHTANWMYWYNSRFKPVFTKTMSVLKGINPKNSAEDAYDLKDQEEYKYYVGIKPKPGEYNSTQSPFKDAAINSSGDQAISFIDNILAKIKSTSEGAKFAQGAAMANGLQEQSKKDAETAKIEEGLDKSKAKDIGKMGVGVAAAAAGGALAASATESKPVTDFIKGAGKFSLLAAVPGIGIITGLAGTFGLFESDTAEDTPKESGYDPFNAIRYKTYGLSSLSESDRISTLARLELMVKENVTISQGKATYKGDIAELVIKACGLFGIDKNDTSGLQRLTMYIGGRFLPAFLNLMNGVRSVLNTTDIFVISRARPSEQMAIATTMMNSEGKYGSVWSCTVSPWEGYTLNTNKASANADINYLKKDVESKGSSEGKIKAIEEANKSTVMGQLSSAMDKVKDYGSNLWNTFKNTTANAWDSIKQNVSAWWNGDKSALDAATDVASNLANGTMANTQALTGDGAGGSLANVPQPTGSGSWGAVKDTIIAAAKVVGVDPGLLAGMAAQESGFQPGIRAKGSSATGLFQFLDGTWKQMLKQYGPKYNIPAGTPATNGAANAILGAQYVKDNIEALRKVTNNVQPGDAYLAHFLGLGGARKALQAGDNASFASLFPQAARANPSYSGTIGQVRAQLTNNMFAKHRSFGVDVPIGGTNTTAGSMPSGGVNPNVAGKSTRYDWANSGFSKNTMAPDKEYMDKMRSFNLARKMVNENKSLSAAEKQAALVKINTEANEYGKQWATTNGVPENAGKPQGNGSTPWMAAAYKYLGLNEVSGDSTVRQFHAAVGLKAGGKTPWCASFVSYILESVGIRSTKSAAAISYKNWGQPAVPGTYPYGAVVVIRFHNGNHVAFCLGEQGGKVRYIGGNQGGAKAGNNGGAVTESSCTKNMVIAVRLPPGYNGSAKAPAGASYNGSVNSMASLPKTPAPVATSSSSEKSAAAKLKAASGSTSSNNPSIPKIQTGSKSTGDLKGLDAKTSLKNALAKSQSGENEVHITKSTNTGDISDLTGTVTDLSILTNGHLNQDGTSTSQPEDNVAKLQSSIRNILKHFGERSDPTMVETTLNKTKEARRKYKEQMDNHSVLDTALKTAKAELDKVNVSEMKNVSEQATKKSVEHSKNINSVAEDILKENKKQTKLLTDILDELRKGKKEISAKDSKTTARDKVNYSNEFRTNPNLSESPVNMRKGNQ
jgi:PHIKZ144